MSHQLSLLDPVEAPPEQGRHNLFFALMPPPAVAEQVNRIALQLRRAHGLTGNLIGADRLHVSLHAVAPDASPLTVDAARFIAARVASPRFEVVFDHVQSFDIHRAGSNPVVLCHSDHRSLADLHRLHKLLHLEVRRAGWPTLVSHGFNPHMTLLYDRQLVPELAIEPVRWTATEFALIDSHVGDGYYECLGTWPLQP
jgi:2'-5' RNA ligase